MGKCKKRCTEVMRFLRKVKFTLSEEKLKACELSAGAILPDSYFDGHRRRFANEEYKPID